MDKKTSLASLEKALGELHSYIGAIKGATFPGKNLEDGAKLLKFLQDNFKTLQLQHQAVAKEIDNESKAVQEEKVVSESSEA